MSSAEALSLILELASCSLDWGLVRAQAEVLEPAGNVVLGVGEVPPTSLAWPVIPSTTTNSIPMPMAIIASINSAAPSAASAVPRWRLELGRPAAADCGNDRRDDHRDHDHRGQGGEPDKAYEQDRDPTSNHDISPTFRSQSGTVKIRLSSPGSISMYPSPCSLVERSRRGATGRGSPERS